MLDRELLDTLTEGDEDFARELVDTFLRSSRGILAKLSRSVDSSEKFASNVHALKGAGMTVGLTSLSNLAARYETLGKQGADPQVLAQGLEEIQAEAQTAERELQDYLQKAFG